MDRAERGNDTPSGKMPAKVADDSRRNPKNGVRPGERRGGRQKGTPNKFSGDVKNMILAALDKKGGVDYLAEQADANPAAFLSLVGKVLPMTVQGDADNPVKTVLEIVWSR